jgi:hypothetical protein
MPVTGAQVEAIIGAAPNFRARWEKFLEEWKSEERFPWYVGFGELAYYIVESYELGKTDEFSHFFETIEDTLQNADPELQNLIAVGLFEDIQNVSSHRDFGAAPFRRWLGPRSGALWDQIDEGSRQLAAWSAKNKPKWWQFWRRRAFDAKPALERVENPELRKILESNYRKTK